MATTTLDRTTYRFERIDLEESLAVDSSVTSLTEVFESMIRSYSGRLNTTTGDIQERIAAAITTAPRRVPTEYQRLQVRHAAAWLDEVKPGWGKLIDLNRLNLFSSYYCVLGQVFAEEANLAMTTGYAYAVSKLGIFNDAVFASNSDFLQAWKDLITERVG